MVTGRTIRPSQFITTYGVGSIIETDNGSRIIPSFKGWGKYFKSRYNCREIFDSSAINQLRQYHQSPRIFMIPSNADLKKKDSMDIYSLDVFPKWAVCMMHSGTPVLAMMNDRGILTCPSCERENLPKKKATGIRFVRACRKGHLDDVEWQILVHYFGSKSCNNNHFEWSGEGQSARDIIIHCEICHSKIQLSQIYRLAREDKLQCSGKFVEKGIGKRALLREGPNTFEKWK